MKNPNYTSSPILSDQSKCLSPSWSGIISMFVLCHMTPLTELPYICLQYAVLKSILRAEGADSCAGREQPDPHHATAKTHISLLR